MPTAQQTTLRRGCVVSGSQQLHTIISFFFGGHGPSEVDEFVLKSTPDLFWKADELGFHISGRIDGDDLYPSRDSTTPTWMRDPHLDLKSLVAEINKWFASLSDEQRREMCWSTPLERAIKHFELHPIGFCIRTTESLDESHEVLTITPAYVKPV